MCTHLTQSVIASWCRWILRNSTDIKSHLNPVTYACEPNVIMHGFSADLTTNQNYGVGWFEINSWIASGKSHLFLKGMKSVLEYCVCTTYSRAASLHPQHNIQEANIGRQD